MRRGRAGPIAGQPGPGGSRNPARSPIQGTPPRPRGAPPDEQEDRPVRAERSPLAPSDFFNGLLEDHVAERPRGALARLLARSRTFETFAEEQGSQLSPWITWPSLHRGVGQEAHAITDFNQELSEVDAAYPSLWELLARAGASVGVCGSVHSNPCTEDPSRYAFYVPDPFARDKRISFEGRPASFGEFGFKNLLLEDQMGQTAYHVPEGILMVAGRGNEGVGGRPSISTLEVAPRILKELGVAAPAYMRGRAGARTKSAAA